MGNKWELFSIRVCIQKAWKWEIVETCPDGGAGFIRCKAQTLAEIGEYLSCASVSGEEDEAHAYILERVRK